jgi:hypothetical protein
MNGVLSPASLSYNMFQKNARHTIPPIILPLQHNLSTPEFRTTEPVVPTTDVPIVAEVLGATVFCGVEVPEFVVTGEAGEFVVGIVILTVSRMKLVPDLRERTLKRTVPL